MEGGTDNLGLAELVWAASKRLCDAAWSVSAELALWMARKWHFIPLLASYLFLCSSQLSSGRRWKCSGQIQCV